MSKTDVGWTVLAFVLALSVAIPVAGWLGDRYGLKRVFLVAMTGFTVASLFCGLSGSLAQLIGFRAVQGAFSGLITPVGAALLYKAYPLDERADASRKIITVVVIAPAIGPVLGGFLIEVASWRWIFFVNIPIGILALVVAGVALREDRHPSPGRLDVSGFVLSVLGLGLLVYGISQGSELGWSSAPVLVALVGSSVFLVTLYRVESTAENPLLALRLLRDPNFRTINFASLPIYAGFLSLVYALPLYLDEAGYSPLEIGLAIVTQPLGVIIATQVTGRVLYHSIGPRRLIVVASLVAFAVGVAIARLPLDTGVWSVRGLMLIRGMAMGVIFIPVQTAVYARISSADLGRATAFFSTVRQFAPALGVAIVATVLAAQLGSGALGENRTQGAYQAAMLASALMYLPAAVIALRVRDADAATTRRMNAPSEKKVT